jgi:hypothetical protein
LYGEFTQFPQVQLSATPAAAAARVRMSDGIRFLTVDTAFSSAKERVEGLSGHGNRACSQKS